MLKKFFLLGAIAGLMLGSCSDNNDNKDDGGNIINGTLEEQIALVKGLSYSQLTPDQQKLKLETDAQEVLDEMASMKSSPAIDAANNLKALMDFDEPDFSKSSEKKSASIDKVMGISDVYGIYEWNATDKAWKKTPSTTEFKFVFPSTNKGTSNDAIVNMTSKSSGVSYTPNTYEPDTYNLPSEAEGRLTINGVLVATAKMNATYANGKPAPEKASSSITFHDYTFVNEGQQGTPNTASSKLTYKDKVIFEAIASGTIDLKKLVADNYADDDYEYNYFGKASSVIKIMNNLIVIGEGDFKTWAATERAINNRDSYGWWNTQDGIDKINASEKKDAEDYAANFNTNQKSVLASRKDLAKIADVIMVAEKGKIDYYYWGGTSWLDTNPSQAGAKTVQKYDIVTYLRFNDNTKVSAETYLSSGFSSFKNNWENFLKAFEKK